jgi:hypothetical protein
VIETRKPKNNERVKTMFTEKLIEIVSKNPGKDAIALKGKGWRPSSHGSLRDAQNAGRIVYINGGWYLSGAVPAKYAHLIPKVETA